jgi:hypothetical protein
MAGKELAVNEPALVGFDVDGAVGFFKAWEEFKSKALTPNDWYDEKGTRRMRKSGFMKAAVAAEVSTEILDERCEKITLDGKDVLAYHFSAKAFFKSGRKMEATASASSDELKLKGKPVHFIRSLAQTRAVNRAISNLIGGGEVSAEEIDAEAAEPRKQVESEAEVKPPEQSAYKPRRFDNPNPAPNGNEQEPIGLWQAIFREAGFTEKEVSDNVELEVLDNYRIAIHQKMSFMPENLWKRFMQVVNDQRGIWNKDKRQWEGPC